MLRTVVLTLIGLVAHFSLAPGVLAQPAASLVERTRGLSRMDGYVPLYWDEGRGRVLAEVPVFDADVLYYVSAASGAGSVELPFDRGILSSEVIHFVRSGPRVLVVAQNLGYRAVGGSAAQRENVRDSFASSVLASLPVEAVEGGRVLVDASPLFLRDAADVEGRLRRANQGTFRFDAARSGFHAPRIKSFPLNAEVETIVTFAADNPGLLVNNVTPDGRFFTLRIHHSFLKAPEGYTPRAADPRIGVSAISFRDYAKPFDQDTETQWITRWRLEKKDPAAAMSEPVTPIVFYLDAGIPEPTRTAMRNGALWWNKAFEAAGFRNAVQVKDPTPDMDPMDIRYSWILWINRDERGFSSGGSFRDPRTGEVLGSKTRMDSHRIRTVGNFFEAYTPTSGDDDAGLAFGDAELVAALAAQPADGMPAAERDMILARQTLLTAHELGHVMGYQHNFSASLDNFGSVMDYPTPRVKVTNGKLDLSDAFPTSIGAYDEMLTKYAYSVFPGGREKEGLDGVIREVRAKGLHFVPDTDPRWWWYDDRATPQEYLKETIAARAIMLRSYGPAILRPGEPVGALRDARLWMTYLHHRWAIESGLRYVGGMFHTFNVKGDPGPATEIVPAATQREVLQLLLSTIAPAALEMPESLLAELTPHPNSNLEDLSADYAFDHLRAARILTAMVLGDLLQADRAARLVAFADRQPNALTLPEVLRMVVAATWGPHGPEPPMQQSLRRVTERAALDALMMLGADADTTPPARAVVLQAIRQLGAEIAGRKDADPMGEAHLRQAEADITRYLEDPAANAPKFVAPGWGRRPRSRYPLNPGPPLGGGGN
ncbi:MAG: zinc-dependent metalloprotease [Vicinamibacterales bacterium]